MVQIQHGSYNEQDGLETDLRDLDDHGCPGILYNRVGNVGYLSHSGNRFPDGGVDCLTCGADLYPLFVHRQAV
jgi:hypothetical protein